METIESRVEPSPGKSAKPSRWLPLAISVIAAGLMVGLAYYGLQYFRSSTVSDERAFRALREMIGQFGNFQSAIAGLLTLVPSDVNADTRKTFQSSLSLEGQWDLQTDECGTAASPDRHAQLIVDTSTAARDFTMTTMGACQIKGDADKSGARKIKLSESLARQLPTFVAQEQFDVVILSLVDGTTLASIPGQRRSEPGSELHDTGSHSLVVAKVSGLLHHAMRQEEAEDFARTKLASAKDEKRELPPHPVVLTDTIAGETYRIFIQPFEPDYPVTIAQANTASPAPQAENAPKQTPLYLVGLKKQDVFKTLVDTFGSTGTLSITLIVLLAVLTWPLMSLKFSSPQEPISSTQVLAASVALLLIPSVVTVTGFSVWSRHRLDSWADRAAEVYAARVERAVLQELSADARTLDDLATQFAANPKMVEKHFKMENTNVACLASARDKLASCMFPLTVPGAGSRVPASWSALRSAAPLNLQGESAGLTIDLFGRPAPERPLDLRDRPYFKAIANGEEWHPDELWSHQDLKADRLRLPAHGLVAQRLFNRSDGARVLQVAVPMHSESDERIGLVTADSRAYALAASVRPPLLRFAVIDSANGVVLFHSDDARSLSENLLVETEQNASLRDVMRKRVAPRTLNRVAVRDHFGGLYLGEWQRFYHRPVAGLPWGIVVFYSAESLAEIVLQTAVATLATSFAFSGVVILVFCLLAFMLPGRPDLDILAALWPKWESRERYRTIAACAAIVVLIEACVVVARLRVGSLVAVGVGMACAVIACHAAIAWMRRRKASGGSQSINVRAYQKYYVGCMLGAMCAISVLPTIWFATDYHDVSVAASVRNELGQAADDVELRYGVIAGDLRRFMPDVGIRTRVDHARTLRDALTVPGYEAQPPDERGAVEWLLLDAQPGLWLRACGPPMIGFVRRTIWALSTAEQAQVQRLRSGAIEPERDPAAGASQSAKNPDICASPRSMCRRSTGRALLACWSGWQPSYQDGIPSEGQRVFDPP